MYARLEDEASLLRRSGDVSMLAQALLDVSECRFHLRADNADKKLRISLLKSVDRRASKRGPLKRIADP